MSIRETLLHKGNPLRSDVSWWVLLIEGVLALLLGLYIVLAGDDARRDIVLVIGLFLLINGLNYAIATLRARNNADPMARSLLIRSGIGIAIGLIVVINWFTSSMGLDAARIVAGIGLFGMGLATLVGVVASRDRAGLQLGAFVTSLLLMAWGIVIFYQVATDSFATRPLGWTAVVIGVLLGALALYRRQVAANESRR